MLILQKLADQIYHLIRIPASGSAIILSGSKSDRQLLELFILLQGFPGQHDLRYATSFQRSVAQLGMLRNSTLLFTIGP
jgi:hypothetical protein